MIHKTRNGNIFHSSKASRLALGTTEPANKRVPGAVSSEVKRQGLEANHSSSSAEVKEASQAKIGACI
jgi:hypothetical protein